MWNCRGKIDPSPASRYITTLVHAHIPGPVDAWRDFPVPVRDLLFDMFTRRFAFTRPEDLPRARAVWEITAQTNLRKSMWEAWDKAMKTTGNRDPMAWVDYGPVWLRRDYWESLCALTATAAHETEADSAAAGFEVTGGSPAPCDPADHTGNTDQRKNVGSVAKAAQKATEHSQLKAASALPASCHVRTSFGTLTSTMSLQKRMCRRSWSLRSAGNYSTTVSAGMDLLVPELLWSAHGSVRCQPQVLPQSDRLRCGQ
ncbi:hypothetical protein Taro_004140, partial [Colocasia esculenta]|nr:hypothetical protein [Colocasia esculenta]